MGATYFVGDVVSENRSRPDQYQLRFPPGMRERIKASADKNNRSMNAEIIAILEEAYSENTTSQSGSRSRFDMNELRDFLSGMRDDIKALTDSEVRARRTREES